MAIAHVNAGGASSNSASVSGAVNGAVLVVLAIRNGSTTPPTAPAGYTSVSTGNLQTGTSSYRLAYKVLDGTETDTGTFTNATAMIWGMYSGVDVGTPLAATNLNVGGAISSTLSYSSLTLNRTNTTSWVVGIGVISSGGSNRTSELSATTAMASVRTNVYAATGTHSFKLIDSGGAVSGSSVATQNDTLSSSATWTSFFFELREGRVGSLAVTEANDTLVATGELGAVSITGSASITEANDTLASTGALLISGTASITEANDMAEGAAGLLVQGAASITEGNDTLVAVGIVALTGSLLITEDDDTITATGALANTGSASLTEEGDTLAATGGSGVGGILAVTEEGDTLAATGTLPIVGVVGITEAGDTLSASGLLLITGSAAITEDGDVAVGMGGNIMTGQAAITEADDTLAATGTLQLIGTLVVTEADDTVVFTGTSPRYGTAAITEQGDTLSATGALAIKAVLAITEEGDTLTATNSGAFYVRVRIGSSWVLKPLKVYVGGSWRSVTKIYRWNGSGWVAL